MTSLACARSSGGSLPAGQAPVGGGLRLGSAALRSPVPLLTPKVLIPIASPGFSAPDTERPPCSFLDTCPAALGPAHLAFLRGLTLGLPSCLSFSPVFLIYPLRVTLLGQPPAAHRRRKYNPRCVTLAPFTNGIRAGETASRTSAGISVVPSSWGQG